MKKIVPLLLSCITLFACVFGLSACFSNYLYRGEHKELYTVAVYSIPDAVGYMSHGEGAYDSDIYIWEQDNYGRTLFSYCEDYCNQIFGLVISQAYDESNVYFYPDINYALTLIDSEYVYNSFEEGYLKNKTEDFYLESKEELKQKNDWNKPLDKTKCVSYAVTNKKVLGKNHIPFWSVRCDEILNDYTQTLNLSNPDKYPHRYNSILQVDVEGKILHEIWGVHQHYDNPNWSKTDEYTSYDIILWVITDKEGNYDKQNGVMVMYSKANAEDMSFIYNAEDVLEFKKQNNWVNLYCSE